MQIHLGDLTAAIDRGDGERIQAALVEVLAPLPLSSSIEIAVGAARRAAPRLVERHPADAWLSAAIDGVVALPPEYEGPGENALATAVVLLNAARDPARPTVQRVAHVAEALCWAASAAGWATYGDKYPAEWRASFERMRLGAPLGRTLLGFMKGKAGDADARAAERREWDEVLESIRHVAVDEP